MSSRLFQIGCAILALIAFKPNATAQIPKGHQILINRGFQIQGMVVNYDVFHLTTYSNANYTSINWLWDSSPSLHGAAPGFPWARWVRNQGEMPPLSSEVPYMSQLVALQLGDEANLNDDAIRNAAINWFNTVRANFPNTILYANNFGGQVGDAQLYDFYSRAMPDMLCFDSYPWKSVYGGVGNPPGPPIPGTPINWYGDLRRYREHAKGANLPLATYRQTFHAIQDYDATVYRDPSPSELRLNTFAALAFNAKVLIDFLYNQGASSLFTPPGGDSNPNALYAEMADVNHRVRNLGKALVRLKPIADVPHPDLHTTSMMFVRGRNSSGAINPIPIGFVPDPQAPNSYTDWVFLQNDPYLNGWVVTNKAGIKNGGTNGDVIISWFRPLDESMDGPDYTNEVYLMVVNGLSDPTGTAPDCLQEIRLNFLVGNSISAVNMLDPQTGLLTTNTMPVISGSGGNTRRQLVLNLNGGDAALFKFTTGAPFVGWPVPPRLSVRRQNSVTTIATDGAVGARYQVEATSSFPATNWTVLTNLLLPASPWMFADTTSSNLTQRFYRALGIP
jgi:hypothetical protein